MIFQALGVRYEQAQASGKAKKRTAAFMRHDVAELDRFPAADGLPIGVDLIRKTSPDSLSVMEFKSATDIAITGKMLRFPLLGEDVPDAWSVSVKQEFNMTSDNHLFHTSPGPGRLPLFTGKMFHHFQLTGEHSGY